MGTPAVVPHYILTLQRRETVANGTMAFHFGKPEHFRFTAGQSLDWALIDPPETDAEGNIRTFTIASAPQDPEIVLATRMRDTAFKRVLASMPLGTGVRAEGPDGSFTLHDDATIPAVFLTGGIGITPFRSMIRDVVARKQAHSLWLFYSNNRPEDAAFLDEFQQLVDTAKSFHFVPTMTEMAKSQQPWYGETKRIDPELISRHLSMRGPRYYLAGPPGMVKDMGKMLTAAGVGDADIRTDEFDGY